MKKIIYGLLTLVGLAVIAQWLMPTLNSGKELPAILGSETFSQTDEEYLVYFYQDTCYYCELLDPTIAKAYATGMTMYKVDMAAEENVGLWYDWEAHHEEYDVEIGEVIDGERVLYEGVSESDYASAEWAIREIEDKVVATHNNAYANFNPTSADEIEIAGTPVLIHIKNGELVKMTGGYNESETYLNELIAESR